MLYPVPLTLEGASVLHEMMRFRWTAWRSTSAEKRARIAAEAQEALSAMSGSALFSLLGHKGDLMFVHFRDGLPGLHEAERRLRTLELAEYMEPVSSYLSVVELGLYDSSLKLFRTLAERGVEPHSDEWNREVEELTAVQRKAMHPRLYPEIPAHRYLCFYPMDRKRGETRNWYQETMENRQHMMHEHGLIGRRYAGQVRQIITGSIGLDDWEWGVDLFADDPLVFKRLIYDMRFDEVSAVYALFGTFYVGLRCQPEDLGDLLEGGTPGQ